MKPDTSNLKTKEREEKVEFPKIDIESAVKYIEMVVSSNKGDIISFGDMGNAIRKKGGNLNRIVTALREYSLIEKSGISEWRITELGKSIAINKNPNDIFKSFISSVINSRLWGKFKGGKPSPNVLIRHIQFSEHIKDKASRKLAKLFLKNYDYIISIIGAGGEPTEETKGTTITKGPISVNEWIKVIQLKYALKPPSKPDIEKLADEVADALGKSNEVSLKAIASSIKEYKDNNDILLVMIENIMKIISAKYPNFAKALNKDQSENE